MKTKSLFISLFLIITGFISAQDVIGDWNGALKVGGMQLRLVFHITKTDAGYSATMDSPDQGAKGIAMSKAAFENRTLTLELDAARIQYSGTLNDAGVITGTFFQGQSYPLDVSRKAFEKEEAINIPEVKDTTLSETNVVLKTKTGEIFGTLTTPKRFSKIPVALIIAGSGPTDRNCNQPTMKCDAYKKLAHELAGKNIATLRFDKRGIAASKAALKSESDIRFDNYISDAIDWIGLLKQDKRFTTIIVIGHSEGSLIGMVAARKADKFISIAGAGRPIDEILKEQLSAQPKEIQDLSYPIMDSLKVGKEVKIVNPKVAFLFRASVQPYLISWFNYNPQTEIKKLTVPILIIQGTNDVQISVDDAKKLAKANPHSQLVLIDKMNHVFRTVEGDREANLATYNKPTLPLSEGLVENIIRFILNN
jgi:hypothetical protein